mgnify:CR=1 FL=1
MLVLIKGEWKSLTNRGKLCYTLTIINMVCEDKEAINYNKEAIMSKILTAKEKEKAMGGNIMCIFSFLIAVICWLGLFDRRCHVGRE